MNTGIERSEDVFVVYPEAAHPGAYEGLDNDAYYQQVLARIEALPGVSRASVSLLNPGTGGGFRETVIRLGDLPDGGQGPPLHEVPWRRDSSRPLGLPWSRDATSSGVTIRGADG